MEISSKLLVRDKNLLHQLTVNNLQVAQVKLRNKHDVITIRKNYHHNQKVVAKIKLDKSIVNNRQNMGQDDVVLQFEQDTISILFNYPTLNHIIKKGFFTYHAQYQLTIPHKITIRIKIKLSKKFYQNKILPQINKQPIKAGKNFDYMKKPVTPEDYRKKDIYESDRDAYRYSPNSDGNRSPHEILSGNFSGESRYRK